MLSSWRMLLPVQPCRLPSSLTWDFHRRRTCLKSKETVTKGELLLPAIDEKDCGTKFKFDTAPGNRHLLNDDILRAIDVTTDQSARWCPDDEMWVRVALSMTVILVLLFIAGCDPIGARQACVEGLQATANESAASEIDGLVSSTGSPSFRCSCGRCRM